MITSARHVAAAFLLVSGCTSGGDEAASTDAQPVVNVQTALATVAPFTETLGAIGTVAPRPGHVAALGALQPARITRVLVAAGQRVTEGQPLVELDQAPFHASAQAAEATLAAAERSLERAQRLAAEGIVPRKDADQAAADLAKARSEAVAAQRAEQLSTLRAPISGIVTRVNASLGATADVAQPLVEIADPRAVDVIVGVSSTEASRIRPGAVVRLSAGQSADGEPLGVGHVADVGGTVDTASRSVSVRVQAPTTRRPLRIAETVFGDIEVAVHPNAIVVPIEALVPDGEEMKVFVVDAAGVAHERKVAIGGRTEKVAEVTGGLAAGERVVTYGAYGLTDSAKVAPMQPAAASKERP
jgi:RND family efflux transporter MFP subunit